MSLSMNKFSKDNKLHESARQAQFLVLLFTPNDTSDRAITKEFKKSPSALSSSRSTREFLRTGEKCGEAQTEDDCLSYFSSVLKNS